MLPSLFCLAALTNLANAAISTYPLPTPTPEKPGAPYSGYKSYDPTELQAPPLPSPLPTLQFPVQVLTQGVNLSAPVPGNFLGFSVELSLANVVIGPNGTVLWPQFLNLMSTLKERGGPPAVRVGGNTQEKAALVGEGYLPDGVTLFKETIGPSGVTDTPAVFFTEDILYAMANVSSLLGVQWYTGIPMNQTDPPRLQIAEAALRILGDNIISFQMGNEPDLYTSHGFRVNYTQQEYFTEYGSMIQAINADPLMTKKKIIGGPSTCCTPGWDTESLIQMGYLEQFSAALNTLVIEHYPSDNCPGQSYVPQTLLQQYMQHGFAVAIAEPYVEIVQQATAQQLPVVLLETNTASCGGFLGLSDSFASALWALDTGMQLATIGFQYMMLHMGGQGVYYNPFVPPPENATAPYQWTVGPVFFANLVAAEALGATGTAQLVDMKPNGANVYTPAYAIYENGKPARVLLINYMTTQGGQDASYTATISVGDALGDSSASPPSVVVRYLTAPGTQSKQNITWAGQSFGGYYEADGLLHGEDGTVTISCPNGQCPITVPAPGAALVFLSGNVPQSSNVEVFSTTYSTHMWNTATVGQVALQTSNGMSGQQRLQLSSTSHGTGSSAAPRGAQVSVLAGILAFVLGAMALRR